MSDLDFVLTFKKECRKDEDFFDMNPNAWEHVKMLCEKHGWNFWALQWIALTIGPAFYYNNSCLLYTSPSPRD